VYQGPFDLLLSLILREEIDLLEVPLLDVILAYVEMTEVSATSQYWDEMTEFLILMSLLVEVKSRLLLPEAYPELEAELTPEEARDELLRRLFEYGKFRSAALHLRQAAEEAAVTLLRTPATHPRRRLAPLEEISGTGDAMELHDSLVRLIVNRRAPDTGHIAQIKVELRRQISVIRRLLSKEGRFSFDRVFGTDESLVQALSLFALLELVSRGEVRVSQSRPFGDIVVTARQTRGSA
jgi:segregation and condensation protein A